MTYDETPGGSEPWGEDEQAYPLGGRIDLNHASKADLMDAGLSESSAQHVLRFRDENSGIEGWADFDHLPIPDDELELLRPKVQF